MIKKIVYLILILSYSLQGATYSVNAGDHFMYNGNTYKATSSTPTCVRVAYYNYPSITAYGGKFRLNDAFYSCSAYGADFVAIVMFDAVVDNSYNCDVGSNGVCYSNICTTLYTINNVDYEENNETDLELCITTQDGSNSDNIWRTAQDCKASTGTCYSIKTCTPLLYPYTSVSSMNESECTIPTLQTLYTANNTDGRTITAAEWNCDDICYFILSAQIETNTTSPVVETNTTESNTTQGTDGTNGVDGTDGTDGTNGVDGTNGTDGADGTNGTDGTNGVDGTNGTDGTDGIDGTNGTDGTNGQDAPSGEYTNILGSINSGISTLHDDLQSLMSDLNSTGDFDDSRIVEANQNTTQAIQDLKNEKSDEIDEDTSFFETFETYYDDIGASVELVENNVNDLMATIQGEYTVSFQTHNTCTIYFPVMGSNISMDMCKYSPILRPFFTFILTIAMLIMLIRLHFYLFPIVMRSD